MVKFSKQLEAQLVPEWKPAFCNYWQLKKDLKQIRSQPRRSINSPRPSISSLTFNDITRRRGSLKDVILVHQRHSVSDQREDFYETELLEPIAQADLDKAFFARLDEQLNKVNQFYRRKEEEYIERGEEIKQQLEKFVTMRKILSAHQNYAAEIQGALSKEQSFSTELEEIVSSFNRSQRRASIELTCDNITAEGEVGTIREQGDCSQSMGTENANCNSTAVHGVDFNIPKATPGLTVSALIQILWDDVLNQAKNGASPSKPFSNLDRKKMHYAEKMIRAAFIEFYRGLGLLRSFSSLNMLAFGKILKKYDKITGRHASLAYVKVVERAYFHSSDRVVNLMDEVERKFTQLFTKGDHKKAMTFLRPMHQKASHKITFFLGLFTGCSFAFLSAFIVLLHLNGHKDHHEFDAGKSLYMDSIYPLFSMLALILLHLYMYGWDLFMWREKRINYAFIFEFATNTEIKYREVLLVATGLSTMVTGGLLVHFMEFASVNTSFNFVIIPLCLVLIFFMLLFCPSNICYRSSRFFFLRSMKHIILAPLYKVVMADFFLADQLTSQVYMFRNAEYILCYYITNHFRIHNSNSCSSHESKNMAFAYLFSFLPYWWRLMQCLRRWIDEGDKLHLANGAKYFSAMMAAGISLTYKNKRTNGWLAVFVTSSTLATCYQLYWDFVIDWGLLNINSKNLLLREQLVLENKNVYFMSMVLNFFLRFAWLQSVIQLQIFNLDQRITDVIFASLEIVRRGHWNFYRLENEHLNNVGKFRAVKTVPLPFRGIERDP